MSRNKTDKTRAAVYIRIGGTGEYASTFEVQKNHFTDAVGKNPDWELAGIYADLGADSRKQPNLGRLMADCRAGRVDLIITKSTSRISRSMNVLMSIVRELAYLKPPVGVYFEDTKLNTMERDNLLFLTMFEAMAIHENKNDLMSHTLLARHLKNQEKQRKNKKTKEDESDEC